MRINTYKKPWNIDTDYIKAGMLGAIFEWFNTNSAILTEIFFRENSWCDQNLHQWSDFSLILCLSRSVYSQAGTGNTDRWKGKTKTGRDRKEWEGNGVKQMSSVTLEFVPFSEFRFVCSRSMTFQWFWLDEIFLVEDKGQSSPLVLHLILFR